MKLGVLFSIFVLAGCATGYKPNGLGGGFSDVQLNADTFQIDVRGNGYTTQERARNIALLRASDLVLAHGFDRFVVVSGGGHVDSSVTPLVSNVVGRTVITTGGDIVNKPNVNFLVRGVRPSDPAYAGAIDAKMIAAQLQPQLAQ